MGANDLQVTGRVIDVAGQGVYEALVAVKTGPDHPDIAVSSAADGSYTLPLLLPGDYVLEARQGERSGTVSIHVPPSGLRDVDIVIS